MGPLFIYTLLPVLSVALLLFFTAALRGRTARGLAMYCLSVAAWSLALLLLAFPRTVALGERLSAFGVFIAAGYLHAAFSATRQPRYGLVWFAYAVAGGITLLGALRPGALFDPVALTRGPLFWPALALAIVAATVPIGLLARQYRTAPATERTTFVALAAAGALAYAGGLTNALLLSSGTALPIGALPVMASLLVTANVLRAHEPPEQRRVLERSLLYSALAALLSAGFLFGVLAWASALGQRFIAGYGLGALFLLAMAALALEPLRQHLQEWLGRRLVSDRASAVELATALAHEERRADQSARLAELGQFASAVAHEIRNPLGVISANLKLLERAGADPDVLASTREQIQRAAHFVDELLRYGRPRPLDIRSIELEPTIELAFSTARQGLGDAAPAVELQNELAPDARTLEADSGQLGQLLVILFENAILALSGSDRRVLRVGTARAAERISIVIEDTGAGIPADIAPRLFEPFVTSRSRSSPKPGTGLGLAIARGIAERHGGTLTAGRSESLGGARFELRLPARQAVLAAASQSSQDRGILGA